MTRSQKPDTAGDGEAQREIYITQRDADQLNELIKEVGSNDGDARDRPYLSVLSEELNRATIVEPERVPPDVVTMNSRVELHDGSQTWVITLVFPSKADPETDHISILAPLGAALLGHRTGSEVSFRVPGGRIRTCSILGIPYQPEAAGDLAS
ncbi:nucleoside diphosphate kinase regulator [Adonisia turfae]